MNDPSSPLLETPSGKNPDTENFPVGSFLIRADLRPHVHAFYRFARAADDISDNPLLDAPTKIARLTQFGAALLDENAHDLPSCVPLRGSLKATGVSPQHSLDLLTAFKQDATKLRYKDWDELMEYCRYSASPVGRHVLALHGVGKEAWPANDALCSALQIINHIQDCADDYRELDRVYIPLDMMLAEGCSPDDLAQESSPPGIRATLNAMLDKLDPLLAKARELPPAIPDLRLRMETSVICALAERLVRMLRARDPLCDNVKLSTLAASVATLRGLVRAWVP